jgi:hypothetical protein
MNSSASQRMDSFFYIPNFKIFRRLVDGCFRVAVFRLGPYWKVPRSIDIKKGKMKFVKHKQV